MGSMNAGADFFVTTLIQTEPLPGIGCFAKMGEIEDNRGLPLDARAARYRLDSKLLAMPDRFEY